MQKSIDIFHKTHYSPVNSSRTERSLLVKRNIEERIEKLMTQFPAVCILGARQVGKTTLARRLRPGWRYLDLQIPRDRDRILTDPEWFFRENPTHLILDEAQTHPIIFDILRNVIDANRQEKGRFIITGSSSPDLLKHISESLAGRIAVIELSTLLHHHFLANTLTRRGFLEDTPKSF
jgi:predicted AAA+ superfamily ATPase